jgi:hypothetical protein
MEKSVYKMHPSSLNSKIQEPDKGIRQVLLM